MTAIPVPGGDADAWGTKLNAWLTTGHNADGTHPASLVTLTGPQTLTNKTLTSPHLTGPVVDSGGLVVAGGLTVDGVQIRQIGSANHSVNGLLNIWQRPIGVYSANGGSAGPDGLFIGLGGTDTMSCTQDLAHADGPRGAESCLACNFVFGTGAGNSSVQSGLGGIKLAADHFRFFRGRQVTRSWWVLTSVANAVRVSSYTDGTGGVLTVGTTHSGSGAWELLTVTTPVIPLDATKLILSVNGIATGLFYIGAHATVLGTVAADPYLVALSPADDLARCQRYYRKLLDGQYVGGYSTAGGIIRAFAPIAPPMAGVPTFTPSGITYSNASGLTPLAVTPNGLSVQYSVTGTADSYVTFTAVLESNP